MGEGVDSLSLRERAGPKLAWEGEGLGTLAGSRFAPSTENPVNPRPPIRDLCQFLLARAVMRKKFDPLVSTLTPAVDAWDRLMATLTAELGHECV